MEKIRTSGKKLVDEFGRERIFCGVNICDKGWYDERTKKRVYSYEWDDKVFENLKFLGFNIVRLGITWDAVEPSRGNYNEDYLDAIERILDKCNENGIYAYIDMHQDLYSGWGNGPGDGAPAWACHTDGHKYHNPRLVWAESYFISKATHRAFDNFWDNKYGVQDDYKRMWMHVAKKFDGHPALFGFDVMNEPFMGTDGGKVFRKLVSSVVSTTITDKRLSKSKMIQKVLKGEPVRVLDLYTAEIFSAITGKTASIVNKFDSGKYMDFLNSTAEDIRKVSKDSIIFIENSYYSNLGINFKGRPITVNGKRDENQLFAPHAYDLMVDTPMYKYANNSRVTDIFAKRKQEQDTTLDMPLLVGEWGGDSVGTEWLHHVECLLELFDSYKWSNTYWHYRSDMNESYVGTILKRPYPRAVTGDIDFYRHDRAKNTFTLEYTQNDDFDVPTEIYAHKPIDRIETDCEYTVEKSDDGSAVVNVKSGKGKHSVKIYFEGKGFSYLHPYEVK